MRYKYLVDNQINLLIEDCVNQTCLWKGNFDNALIQKILPIPGSDECLILLDYNNSMQKNLIKVDPFGNIIWQAEAPGTYDFYLDMNISEKGIEAITWNGINVLLEAKSGKYTIRKFLK